MKRLLYLLALSSATVCVGQEPAFTTPLVIDAYQRLDLLDNNTAVVCGGHLQGISFYRRAAAVALGETDATINWTYNEDDVHNGFSTSVTVLSDGNVLLYTPEDVALLNADLSMHLTKLTPDGDELWTTSHEVPLQNVFFQARLRAFETQDGRIVYFTPTTPSAEAVADFELRYYDLEGNFLEAAPVALDFSLGYDINDCYLTAGGVFVLAGRSDNQAVLIGIAADGEVLFEHSTLAGDSWSPWYTQIAERSNGELLVSGYVAPNEGNLGLMHRYAADGSFLEEFIFGDEAGDVVISRCLRELPDGRVMIGLRWMGENEIWSPRLVILDPTLQTEVFSYLWETELFGLVENFSIAPNGGIVGLNAMLLGTSERTDIWRLYLEPVVSVGEYALERFRIGPNPAVDRLQVFGPASGEWRLLGLDGRELDRGALGPDGIDISGLPAAAYLLEVQGPDGPVRIRWTKA